jgi:hypothetical protein
MRARSTTISRLCPPFAPIVMSCKCSGAPPIREDSRALAEIQDDYEKSPTPENKAHLDTLQSAITTMFLDMEAGFASRADWNFRHTVEYKIAHFLSGFDGIFTLNQDLLFERHYHDLDLALNQPKKWFGWRRPGIQVLPDPRQTTNDVEKTT